MKDYEAERVELISHLRDETRDTRVLDVMAQIPRELFVPETHRYLAYNDQPMPIGAEDTLGWEYDKPYDATIVTAGAPSVPEALLDQLVVGGRMTIPVGDRFIQELYKITKLRDSKDIQKLGGCRFVSLIGKDAWQN